jgi:hypothetical protein
MRTAGLIAILFLTSLCGCTAADLDTVYEKWPAHEHNNFCGHAYQNDVHLNPTPGDFAGPGAPWGPMSENEIRIKDPFRGDRPVPERPVPRSVQGGNPADRAPERGVFPWERERIKTAPLPEWPLPQPTPSEKEEE